MRFQRAVTYARDVQLQVIDCWECGVVFGLSTAFDEGKRLSHDAFFCPNGHRNVYGLGETAVDREKRELLQRAERAEADAAQQRQMRTTAEKWARGANIASGIAKAAKRRLEERVAAGVCPCCQRTFKQLAAHMRSKHPERVKPSGRFKRA